MESISQRHCVYLLLYPNNYPDQTLAGKPFYVGKGHTTGRPRAEGHIYEAKAGMLTAKCDVIRKILALGLEVVYIIVAEFDTEPEAYAYEQTLIRYYGESLTNVTHNCRKGRKISPKKQFMVTPLMELFWKECSRANILFEIITEMTEVRKAIVFDACSGRAQPPLELALKWISILGSSDEVARQMLDGFGYVDIPVKRIPVETYPEFRQRKHEERIARNKLKAQGIEESRGYTLSGETMQTKKGNITLTDLSELTNLPLHQITAHKSLAMMLFTEKEQAEMARKQISEVALIKQLELASAGYGWTLDVLFAQEIKQRHSQEAG